MYSQQRLVQNAEEQLYFRHAPPVLERQLRLDTYPGKSPKVPFKGAKGWQCSVYYFWWRFLRENEAFRSRQHEGEDAREGRVAYDFRHVHGMNFPNWWVAHGRFLFCEPKSTGVRILRDPLPSSVPEGRVVVSIPFNGDIDRTLAELRGVLKPAFHEMQLAQGPSKAKYPVLVTTPLNALYRRYNIWRIKRDNPKLSLHEVALMGGALPSGPIEDNDVRRSLAAGCSRDLKDAKTLIDHVGRGFFPVLSEKHIPPSPLSFSSADEGEPADEPESATAEEMALWLDQLYRDEPVKAASYKAAILPALSQASED